MRWAWIALLALFLLARIAFIDADPPLEVSGSVARSQDFWLEPPAKAHEARNWALFGEWQTNDADRYQFWRKQSPMWVYPLAGVFSVLGVSYATLRFFSVSVALLGFVIALALARERVHRSAWVVLGVCLATNYHSILFDRSGLIEVMVSTLVAGMVLCLFKAQRHPAWLVGSQICFALAFFAKQGAAYAFPLLVVFNVLGFLRYRRDGRFSVFVQWAPVLTAISIACLALTYVAQPAYQRSIAWNYNHMLFADEHEGFFVRTLGIFRRALLLRRYTHHWFWPFPVFGAIAIVAWVRIVLSALRTRMWSDWDMLIAAWFLSAWVALLVIRQDDLRFTAILVLPMFLLVGQIGSDVVALCRRRLSSQGGRYLLAGGVALVVLPEFLQYARWVRERRYDLVIGARLIEENVGHRDAVIVGRFSAPLVLETPYVHYYVKWYFNTDVDVMRAMGITHALWRTYEEETRIHLGKLGDVSENYRSLALMPFRGDEIELVEFAAPLK